MGSSRVDAGVKCQSLKRLGLDGRRAAADGLVRESVVLSRLVRKRVGARALRWGSTGDHREQKSRGQDAFFAI